MEIKLLKFCEIVTALEDKPRLESSERDRAAPTYAIVPPYVLLTLRGLKRTQMAHVTCGRCDRTVISSHRFSDAALTLALARAGGPTAETIGRATKQISSTRRQTSRETEATFSCKAWMLSWQTLIDVT
jgi:hypothetical protein